jgi:hypothetical protein
MIRGTSPGAPEGMTPRGAPPRRSPWRARPCPLAPMDPPKRTLQGPHGPEQIQRDGMTEGILGKGFQGNQHRRDPRVPRGLLSKESSPGRPPAPRRGSEERVFRGLSLIRNPYYEPRGFSPGLEPILS